MASVARNPRLPGLAVAPPEQASVRRLTLGDADHQLRQRRLVHLLGPVPDPFGQAVAGAGRDRDHDRRRDRPAGERTAGRARRSLRHHRGAGSAVAAAGCRFRRLSRRARLLGLPARRVRDRGGGPRLDRPAIGPRPAGLGIAGAAPDARNGTRGRQRRLRARLGPRRRRGGPRQSHGVHRRPARQRRQLPRLRADRYRPAVHRQAPAAATDGHRRAPRPAVPDPGRDRRRARALLGNALERGCLCGWPATRWRRCGSRQ